MKNGKHFTKLTKNGTESQFKRFDFNYRPGNIGLVVVHFASEENSSTEYFN